MGAEPCRSRRWQSPNKETGPAAIPRASESVASARLVAFRLSLLSWGRNCWPQGQFLKLSPHRARKRPFPSLGPGRVACKAQTGAYGRAERSRRAAPGAEPERSDGLRAAPEAPTLGPPPASRTACQERADAGAQTGSRLEHDVKSTGLTGTPAPTATAPASRRRTDLTA